MEITANADNFPVRRMPLPLVEKVVRHSTITVGPDGIVGGGIYIEANDLQA